MLDVRKISIGYDSDTVLKNVSFSLHKGGIGCLLGPSGSGKTSLLRAIAGFVKPVNGKILIDGECVASTSGYVPAEQRKVGMVFQDYALFPHLTVSENIAFGLSGEPIATARKRVENCLEMIGLAEKRDVYPYELSGGQQQRVALARALAPKPQLLLMDEPFSSLDVELRDSLAAQMRSIIKHENITALLVTHDQHEAFSVADEIGVFAEGEMQQWGDASALYNMPATHFVAGFIGDGALLDMRDEESTLLVRPEHVDIRDTGRFLGQIKSRQFRGDHFVYQISIAQGQGIDMVSALLNCKGELSNPCEVDKQVAFDIDLARTVRLK